MKKKYLLATFVVSVLLVHVPASAATVDEIRAQIQSLMSQIAALQAQLNDLADTSAVTTSGSCPNIYRALSRGSRGNDVSSLQQFLIAKNLLGRSFATGYFGPLTESAVQRWQAQNGVVSSGSPETTGYGVFGPKTRAVLATQCGTTTPPIVQSCPGPKPTTQCSGTWVSRYKTDNYYGDGCTKRWVCELETTTSELLNASPSSGAAPLAVSFSGSLWSLGYSIDFGDGTSSGDVGCAHGACPNIFEDQRAKFSPTSVSATHTYTSPGTYTAKLRKHFSSNAGNCAGTDCNVVGTATITVTKY